MLGEQPGPGLADVVTGDVGADDCLIAARPGLSLLAGGKDLSSVERIISRKDFGGEHTIAVTVYLLVAILKKRLKLNPSLHTILQILSVHPFEKPPLSHTLSQADYTISEGIDCIQLKLFDL